MMLPASKPSIWRIPPLHILYLWVEQMSFWVKNVKKNQEKSHRECSTEETWWRQTLMSMIGNDDKEGNDVIEDIDILCPCHILLPYPDASVACNLDKSKAHRRKIMENESLFHDMTHWVFHYFIDWEVVMYFIDTLNIFCCHARILRLEKKLKSHWTFNIQMHAGGKWNNNRMRLINKCKHKLKLIFPLKWNAWIKNNQFHDILHSTIHMYWLAMLWFYDIMIIEVG